MGFMIVRNHDGICYRLRDNISHMVLDSEDHPVVMNSQLEYT